MATRFVTHTSLLLVGPSPGQAADIGRHGAERQLELTAQQRIEPRTTSRGDLVSGGGRMEEVTNDPDGLGVGIDPFTPNSLLAPTSRCFILGRLPHSVGLAPRVVCSRACSRFRTLGLRLVGFDPLGHRFAAVSGRPKAGEVVYGTATCARLAPIRFFEKQQGGRSPVGVLHGI
ncbi:MAG: hypothetical protein P4L84_02285 [Isosphaeraceae bacterium]|nr:hypothetical protein [Isosphaeraceae bacterium]